MIRPGQKHYRNLRVNYDTMLRSPNGYAIQVHLVEVNNVKPRRPSLWQRIRRLICV